MYGECAFLAPCGGVSHIWAMWVCSPCGVFLVVFFVIFLSHMANVGSLTLCPNSALLFFFFFFFFQALRIEVNCEMAQLEALLGDAAKLVKTGGRCVREMCATCFH